MTYLRHAPRHVHASVVNHLTARLTTLGWLGPSSVPFGLDPIKVIDTRPFVGGKLDSQIAAGVVAVTMGNELPSTFEELGGPLSQQQYPIFCDVFMAGESAAQALASDVRDIFMGRLLDHLTSIQVIDQTTDTVVTDMRIYFEDTERVAPEHTFPLSWNSVHVTASCYFSEVRY